MNIRKTTLSSLFFPFLIVTSYTKDGEMGPAGPRGERGIAGGNGTRIYSGTSTPVSTLGQVGDFYFRTETGDFYGPKTAEAGWGIPTNMKGDNGNRIYGNAISPTNSVGTIGDFYINTFDGNTQMPPFFVEQLMGPSSNAAYYYKAYKGYIDIHKASGNFEHNCIDGYRYVLVPGGIRIGANINVNDFNQVKAAFNIAD